MQESIKSLKLQLTEKEAEIRNIEELKNKKKMKILNPEATLVKSVEEQKEEAHHQCL